jgi:hypothetical protein
MGGKMELTQEQLEVIREASREIDFGQITVKFAGKLSDVVDIAVEKRLRFRHDKAEPTSGEPVDRHGSGRY